jgi:serine O-acetyltransferase
MRSALVGFRIMWNDLRADLVATCASDRPERWLLSMCVRHALVAQLAFRWSTSAQTRPSRFLARLFTVLARSWSGVELQRGAEIGPGLIIVHGQGVVIGPTVKIGRNCRIYQNVTIGENHGEEPVLGDRVVLHPGCVVVGGIHVGNGAHIGANAVVTKNVPSNHVAMGVPATSRPLPAC